MDEEEPRVLVPMITGNIVLRGLPYDVKERLVRVKRDMNWNSWADMAFWVLDNSEKITHEDIIWDDSDTGYIVCREVPIEVRDELAKLKRIHNWSKWTDMVYFVLSELEVKQNDLQD